MSAATKCALALIGLGVIDAVIPIPIVTLILLYVIVDRPPWFGRLVKDIYGSRL